MALVIESIDASGIVTRAPAEPGTPLEIPAEPGTRYRIVDDQGRAVGAGPKVIRQGDDLTVENFADGEKIVLKDFFTACTTDDKCALSTEEIGGEFEGLITPDSDPVAALTEGGYLMFVGENNRSTEALPIEPGSEFNWKPVAAGIGALVVLGGVAGGGGGGDGGVDTTPPADPTLTTTTVSANSLLLTGGAEPNSSVSVLVDAGSTGTNDALYSTTANAAGVWAIDLSSAMPTSGSLPAGGLPTDNTSTISVQATDASNNSSALISAQIAVGPNAPTIAVVEGDDIVDLAEATDDVEVSGTSEPSTTVTVTWGSEVRTVNTAADGTWTATFTAAQLPADGAGEISAVATNSQGTESDAATRAVTVDQTAPNLSITSSEAQATNEAVIFTFDFGEAVTGFTLADITVEDATVGAFTAVSASEYTLVVAPEADTDVTAQVSVAADAAVDMSGNGNAAEAATQAFDTESPALVITDNAPGAASGPVTFTFTFSETVTGFTAADIAVAGGTKGAFAGSGDTYTLVVTPTGAEGTIDVAVAAGVALDTAGNGNSAAQASQDFDATNPSVVISNPVGAGDVANGPLVYTFTFSEPVSGFANNDIIVAGGTKSAFQTVTAGLVYRVTVTPTANAEGVIEVSTRANAAVDSAGNQTALTEALDQPFDTLDPTLAITATNGGDDAGPITYTFTFSEPVTGFVASDLTVSSSGEPPTIGALTQISSLVYRMVITPADDDTGTIGVAVAANRYADANGNANSAAAAAPAQAYDTVVLPEVTITSNVAVGETAIGPVTYTFTWSEPVSAFTTADITSVVNGTRGTLVTVTPGLVFTMVVTPDDETEGNMTLTVRNNAAEDANGNRSNATTSDPVAIDTFEPELNITSSAGGTDADGPFVLTFDFGEEVTGFTLADITVSVGAGTDPTLGTLVTTNDIVYTLTVTPETNEDGTMTFTVAAGAADDLAGNGSEADSFDQGYDTSGVAGGLTGDNFALNGLNNTI